MSASVLDYVAGAVFVAVFGGLWAAAGWRYARRKQVEHRARQRARRAELAAWAAAEDDPAFAPDRLREVVAHVFDAARAIWDDGSTAVADRRPDAAVVTQWAREKARLGSGLRLEAPAELAVLRVVNRHGEDEDRVVVRMRARLHRDRPKPQFRGDLSHLEVPTTVKLDERWTLGRESERWFLLDVEGDPLAAPVLAAPLITGPTDDDTRLLESSLLELAREDSEGPSKPGELVGESRSPLSALMDLSLVDGRFAPALLEASLARLIETWEEASRGSEQPLLELASPAAVRTLLHPTEEAFQPRLLIRDASLVRWQLTQFDPAADPPQLIVDLTVEATRFVIDERTGGRIAGSQTARNHMRPAWTLELRDDGPSQWRLIASTHPVEGLQYFGRIYERHRRPQGQW